MAGTKSTFKGKVTVGHAATGYSVRFHPGTQTDGHDLGHALAAVITAYVSQSRRDGCPPAQLATLEETVLAGIRCGLANNPVPLDEKH